MGQLYGFQTSKTEEEKISDMAPDSRRGTLYK